MTCFPTQKHLYTTIKVTKDSEISQWHLFTIILYGFLPCKTRIDVYHNVLASSYCESKAYGFSHVWKTEYRDRTVVFCISCRVAQLYFSSALKAVTVAEAAAVCDTSEGLLFSSCHPGVCRSCLQETDN